MAVMRWTFEDLYLRFQAKAYKSPGDDETIEAMETVNDGYLMFLSEADWTFLHQTSTLALIAYKRTETPANVQVGDVFKVDLEDAAENSYEISFTATAATVANVVTGLYNAAAVAAAAGYSPWDLVTFTDDTTHLSIRPNSVDLALSATTTATDGGGTDTQTLTDAAVSLEGVAALPADFGEFAQDPVIDSGIVDAPRLEWRTPEWIADYVQAANEFPSVPLFYGLRESTWAKTTGSRRELIVAPWPNTDYTLAISYRIEPETMADDDDEYPMGAAAHGPTILAAAFAIWEERTGKTDGVMQRLYDRALARSLRRDRQQRARILGWTPPERAAPRGRWLNTITYE